MPELPEVEVVKRSLINKTQNLIVKAVKINDGRLRYNVDRKFHELENVDKSKALNASIIHPSLKNLKWINKYDEPLNEIKLLPGFTYDCEYSPSFFSLLFRNLKDKGFLNMQSKYINGNYRRYSGDAVELNKGEIFIFDN